MQSVEAMCLLEGPDSLGVVLPEALAHLAPESQPPASRPLPTVAKVSRRLLPRLSRPSVSSSFSDTLLPFLLPRLPMLPWLAVRERDIS